MKMSRIALGVLVYNENQQVLLGKRTSKRAYGTWSTPGGHLEFGESAEECAARELMEEAGIQITDMTLVATTSIMYEDQHYITIFIAGNTTGTPINCEPEKCAGWQWFSWDNLPEPLLQSMKNLLQKKSPKELLPKNMPSLPKTTFKTPETSA